MKKIALIISILIPVALFAQRKSADFDRVNVREILHMNGVTAIQPDGSLIDYINMDDPVNGTDGVNLRTLEAYRDSAQIIDIDSLYNLFQYFPSFGDSTLNGDSTFYIRPRPNCSNCWDYRYFASSTWTEWFCAENGNPNLRINENAYSILEIDNWDLKFRETPRYLYGVFAPPKYSVLVHRDSTFEWQNNLIIDDGITAIGEGAGATGKSSIVLSGTVFYPNSTETHAVQDTQWYYTYDSQPYDNVILIGKEVAATNDNQAVIGDSTITQLFVHGYYSGNGFILYDTLTDQFDTLYLKHLVLNPADSGKVLTHYKDSVYWAEKDSIFINNTWYDFGDTIIVGSLDSIYDENSETWIKDTIPAIVQIDSFIELDDTPVEYPANYGQSVINDGDKVVFANYGEDSNGFWIKADTTSSAVIGSELLDNYHFTGSPSGWNYSGSYWGYTEPGDGVMYINYTSPDTIFNHTLTQNVELNSNSQYRLSVSLQLSSNSGHVSFYYNDVLLFQTSGGGYNFSSPLIVVDFYPNESGLNQFKLLADSLSVDLYISYISIREKIYERSGAMRIIDDNRNTLYQMPSNDGLANQFLMTDGSGNVDFYDVESDSIYSPVDTAWLKNGDTIGVGTISVKDFWYGTQAEYDANTSKNGISPQASNTIAFILD